MTDDNESDQNGPRIVAETFGAVNNEDALTADRHEVVRGVLQRLRDLLGDISGATFITGMNEEYTYALLDVIDEDNLDMDVEVFYPPVNDIMEEDDVSRPEAWQRGYTWRNAQALSGDDAASIVLRLGDHGDNGQALLRQARHEGAIAIDMVLEEYFDPEVAYEDQADLEADSQADSEAEA